MWWNLKTQIVMKLKNSNCDKTQKLNLWWNSKLKFWWNSNLNDNKTQNLKLQEKTLIVTKLKLWEEKKLKNLKCDQLKLWQNSITKIMIHSTTQILKTSTKNQILSKTQIVMKLKLWWSSKTLILMKLKNSNCDKTQKLKFNPKLKAWRKKPSKTQNLTTQIVTKLKKSNYYKTQKLKLWQNS